MRTRLILDQAPRQKDSLIVAESIQDVEPILEDNKIWRSEKQRSDFCRLIAQVPNVIALAWFHEEQKRGNVNLRMYSKEFNELMKKKLQDPEWKYLRTDK